jgi:hypothetical protein
MRRWTDSTGKFSAAAQFVEVNGDRVVLKKASGATVTVPLSRLSDADREYLKTLAKPDAKPAVAEINLRPNLVFPDAMTEPPAWNDANTPFDMAAFLKGPPPEENAAPLYLEALYEFAPTEMEAILYPNLPFEEKKRLWDSWRPRRNEQTRLEETWEQDPKSVDGKAVDAWLANFDVGFQKLAAAQQRPKCMFQPGRSMHSLWPHTQSCRQVARVIAWRSRRDLERGDLERPIQDIQTLRRLSRDQRVRGGFVSQVVSDAVDWRCCELATAVLNAPTITVRHCDRLLTLFAEQEANAVDSFVEGNRAEYISSRQALHDLQHRTGTFDPKVMKDELAIDGDTTSPLVCIKYFVNMGSEKDAAKIGRLMPALLPGAMTGGKMFSDENYAKEVAAMNKFFMTFLSLAEQPDFRRQGKTEGKAAEAALDETVLATFVVIPEAALLEATRRNNVCLRGTRCLVALRRWQLEHADAAPPDLATLVKAAGMPGVPLDPYSNQPLRLALIAKRPVIYSVGPDGKDARRKSNGRRLPTNRVISSSAWNPRPNQASSGIKLGNRKC